MVNVKQVLIGKPFRNSDAMHERLDKLRGLAVFASDPISSNAYATEAIMSTLLLLGTMSLNKTLPIAIIIAILVGIVVYSYNQTIHHYPQGGGAYSVTKDNLGTIPSLFAAAALLTDYILTVSVSVAAGVRAIASAFPQYQFLHDQRILIGIAIIAIITWLNLRGVRESGTIFAIPTYAFFSSVLIIIVWGLSRYVGLFGEPLVYVPEVASTAASGSTMLNLSNVAIIWVLLRAFAAGCTALTGIEAISNGVKAFQEPAPRNAIQTMRAMGLIAMSLFIGISFLATQLHLIPNERESILSQLTRVVTGGGPFYYVVQACTMLILVLAANTAYQDFPRLSAFLAKDGFLPRWMTQLGSRLVYSRGIFVLAAIASLLLVLFNGDEIRLLPLYALGVFVSFTLSQLGMVVLFGKIAKLQPDETLDTGVTTLHYEGDVTWKKVPNMVGSVMTGLVLAILAVTKFREGAWLIVLMLPTMVLLFLAIQRHYAEVTKQLRLTGLKPEQLRMPADVAIVPISDLNRASLRAIRYARLFSKDVRVVKVTTSEEEEQSLCERWQQWSVYTADCHLIYLRTEYRTVVEPLVGYIRKVGKSEFDGQLLTLVVPEFVAATFWERLLHNQTAYGMRRALHNEPNVVIIDVPYQLFDQARLSATQPVQAVHAA